MSSSPPLEIARRVVHASNVAALLWAMLRPSHKRLRRSSCSRVRTSVGVKVIAAAAAGEDGNRAGALAASGLAGSTGVGVKRPGCSAATMAGCSAELPPEMGSRPGGRGAFRYRSDGRDFRERALRNSRSVQEQGGDCQDHFTHLSTLRHLVAVETAVAWMPEYLAGAPTPMGGWFQTDGRESHDSRTACDWD